MIRAALIAAAALLLLGAAPEPFVDYRVTVAPAGGPSVEMHFRGEPDGETRLRLPADAVGLKVTGAVAQGSGEATLRHKPGADIRVRYGFAGGGREFTVLGAALFGEPVGWDTLAARVRWTKLPKGWRVVSDLDHAGLGGPPLTVADVRRSVLVGGPAVDVTEKTTPGGLIRAAIPNGYPKGGGSLVDVAAPAVAAMRSYLGEPAGPFFLTYAPIRTRFVDLDDALVLPPPPSGEPNLQRVIVQAHLVGLLENRAGPPPPRPANWLTGGLSQFLADRVLVRAGLMSPDAWVGRWVGIDAAPDAGERAAILALKWDDDIRRKTGGKADLDDVILRMRDHARQFPTGHAPDVVTGLVSAVWVTAGLDIRPDIARYAEGTAPIPLADELFGGCILARVTVSPGFDAGFDTQSSFATKTVRGVRRRGPAWNSGVRDGMRLESWTFSPGDMTRQVELLVRTPKMSSKIKPRRIAYWPYGDADVSARKIQFLPDLSRDQLAQCARRIGGL